MIRISIFDEPLTLTLKVEGKLTRGWVAELRSAWLSLPIHVANRRTVVDLYGVSFVDPDGRDLLIAMHGKGARLVGSGPMISSLIEEIQGETKTAKAWIKRRIVSLLLLLALLAAAGRLFAQAPDTSFELRDMPRRDSEMYSGDLGKSKDTIPYPGCIAERGKRDDSGQNIIGLSRSYRSAAHDRAVDLWD